MPALPPIEDLQGVGLHPNTISAYNICTELESQATIEQSRIRVRVLGYMIIHAPSEMALYELVKVIHSCARDSRSSLFDLGESFINCFIRPFKNARGRKPASSDHPSHPSVDQGKRELMEQIGEAPKDHKEAKSQALIRDGFRCIITGKYDVAAKKSLHVDKVTIHKVGAVHTECAHIVPESTYFDVSNTHTTPPHKKDHAASVLAVLKHFGYDIENLNGSKVHSLYNVMTMQKDVHDWFGRLEMWFERTEDVNCYWVKTSDEDYLVPEKVTFTSSDATRLPVPSSELLALHAACAKVAHLSGAYEEIDRFDRDLDNLHVLAADGSSSSVLAHALSDQILKMWGEVKG